MFIIQVSLSPTPDPLLSWNYFNKCGNTIDFRILVIRFFIITPKKQLNTKYSVYLTAKFCLNFLYIFEYYFDVLLKLSFGSVLQIILQRDLIHSLGRHENTLPEQYTNVCVRLTQVVVTMNPPCPEMFIYLCVINMI